MLTELSRTWRLRVHEAPLTAGRCLMTLLPRTVLCRQPRRCEIRDLYGCATDCRIR
jgi:hypothetical protein